MDISLLLDLSDRLDMFDFDKSMTGKHQVVTMNFR
jgi:hypothetical protein